jgi:hypothetical protein
MKAGYSLLIDEYVDVNMAEPPDCDRLRICCPVCLEPVALAADSGAPTFRHAVPTAATQQSKCESQAAEFTGEYRDLHNARARKQRLEFLRWNMFKELLGKDPLTHYEKHIWEEIPKVLGLSAFSWLPEWHWEFVADTPRNRLHDSVEFFMSAENYLRSADRQFPHVPESGYSRQVHIQVAFDFMQSLIARQDLGDDYEWLFAHAFRICLGKWVGGAHVEPDDQAQMESETAEVKERVAAARILSCCAIDLMSEDKGVVVKAVETLNEVWTEPPILPERIPFMMYLAADVAGEMEATLYRLPYLPLIGSYVRPCRPPVD